MSRNTLAQSPSRSHYDVVIVGGAMLGSSVAWFLMDNPDFNGTVLVVEREPGYERSSTLASNSCIRQQFSQEINIRCSQFAAEFINNLRHFMGNDPRVPELKIHSFGYLYLADNDEFAALLRRNQKLQQACGAATRILTPADIAERFPFYHLDDIVLGSHNPVDEGYWDGMTVFDWWRRLSREQGVEYLANEVVSMTRNHAGTRVESVTLASGETVGCGHVVNASGPRAVRTSRMAGIDIPVEPRKRYTYVFSAEQPLDRDLPLTIDPSGVHMRTDGPHYMAGCPPDDDPAVDYDDFVEDHHLWQDKVWPALASRVPQFEAIRLVRSWVGHYAYNRFDHNAIVGPHTTVQNFLFVNGFSGHGLQQSPAMGRGIAELIAYGEYRALDLSAFSYARIENQQAFDESAII